jgi:nucleotide-binding universal stress UspA family protein
VGLTVVHTWWLDFVGGGVSGVPDEQERRMAIDEERAVAAEAVAGWGEMFPDVDVRQHVLAGHPVESLVSHSKGAELLVVGSRGRSGFSGMLLGSVSQAVLQHAHCPVAVVRPRAGAQTMSAGAR